MTGPAAVPNPRPVGASAPVPDLHPLEADLASVETCLAQLHDALLGRDPDAVVGRADALRAALATALERGMLAARNGGVPLLLRLRLELVGAQVATQRDSLARATAALDRAVDTLFPQATAQGSLYSASGQTGRPAGRGNLQA